MFPSTVKHTYMLTAGHYYTLRVNRISDYGLYLADADGEEVLLPNRYVSLADKEGDTKEVFVYHDSEDRLVATTERPFAAAGEAAFLEVVDKTVHGAFLDWGLAAKDLFLPNRNQQYALEPHRKYPVFVYTDNITGRVVASTKLNTFISNKELALRHGQRVEILVAQAMPIGFRVVVDNRHWGMIYRNQLFREVKIGDRLTGYVRRVTEDNRVDISLQQEGFDEVKNSARLLLEIAAKQGGFLPVCDASSPEEIAAATRMSKKLFKRSLGVLLKNGSMVQENGGIRVTNGTKK